MRAIPIVSHYRVEPPPKLVAAAERLAARLCREQPELEVPEQFRPLRPERVSGPSLHVDDLSGINQLDRYYDVTFLQDRARLRADTGDFVATQHCPVEGYDDYCREFLGLGSPEWLHPSRAMIPLDVAWACWTDRRTRRALVRAIRSGDLASVHPHMGTLSVWELAAMLQRASRRTVQVIAPPPELSRRVNDKLWFSRVAARLFGEGSIPKTAPAGNLASAARLVRDLADSGDLAVLKLPDSAGGGGNLVVNVSRFRRKSLRDIRADLGELVDELEWQPGGELLVGRWESDVLCAPSAQLWIPPEAEGPPIVEGLFEQLLEGREAYFVGSAPARFSSDLSGTLAERSWLLGRCFQRLGYVGRCSLDLLLVGEDLNEARLEFIECNGRWGGTSLLMTLMNRIFGDWRRQPYAHRECRVPRLDRLAFKDLLGYFEGDLFNVQSGNGTLILYNPGRMQAHSGINVLALADSWDRAKELVQCEVPARLRDLVRSVRKSSR